MPTKSEITESVRRYMQSIGSKGGQAGKGSEIRREIGRRIARARWAAIRANGGKNWAKPKRPKRKRPQAKPPKAKKKAQAHFEVDKFPPKVVRKFLVSTRHMATTPMIGFK